MMESSLELDTDWVSAYVLEHCWPSPSTFMNLCLSH